MNKTYKIAVVNGDGIGREIVPAGMEIVNAAAEKYGFSISTKSYPYGAGYYKEHGAFMAEGALESLKAFDAIFFGAVGLPEVDDTLPARDFTFKVRTSFEQYVNYRPVKLFPGVVSPLRNKTEKDIDFVVIRENNECEFVQSGKIMHPEKAGGLAIDTTIVTRMGVERIAHFAFKLARKRNKKVTNVTKSNTLIHSLKYWDTIIEEVASQYPDVTFNKMYIDNASANFVLHPELFDVVLTTNLFGDILSDLGGAIMGSLGFGGSGNLNPEKDFPSMFEPIHGSAPDIAGKGIANPIGQIWSAAIMLEHLGEIEAADAIVKAIGMATSNGELTKDVGGSASTTEIKERVLLAFDSL